MSNPTFSDKSARPNKFNYPDWFVKTVEMNSRHQYVPGGISVTELIDSPKVSVLRRLHKDTVTKDNDISNDMWIFFGHASHYVVEQAVLYNPDDIISEKLLSAEFKIDGHPEPVTLYGTPDMFIRSLGELNDLKFTSVWSWVFQDEKTSWSAQLNVYAWLIENIGFARATDKHMELHELLTCLKEMKKLGIGNPTSVDEKIAEFELKVSEEAKNVYYEKYKVNDIWIRMLLKDFQQSKANEGGNYPQSPFESVQIKKYPSETIEKYIKQRLKLHMDARNGDPQQYMCSDKERWAKKDQFKVMPKPNAPRSLRNFDDKDAADKYLDSIRNANPLAFVQTIKGESVRCKSYCPAAPFCKQYQDELKSKIVNP